MTTPFQIVFQTTNPRRLADFWRAALDYATEPPPDGFNTWEQFAQQTGIDLSDSDIDAAVDPDGNELGCCSSAPTRSQQAAPFTSTST